MTSLRSAGVTFILCGIICLTVSVWSYFRADGFATAGWLVGAVISAAAASFARDVKDVLQLLGPHR